MKGMSHGCPFARAPLLYSKELIFISAVIEVDARKASASTGVIFDADGICAGIGIVAGVVACLARGFIHAIIVAVHTVVVAPARGGDSELGVR